LSASFLYWWILIYPDPKKDRLTEPIIPGPHDQGIGKTFAREPAPSISLRQRQLRRAIQKGIPFAANRLRAYSSAMPSEEEEMSLTKWRDLLGTELIIALEEIAKIEREGGNERHLYYVESCVEQSWTIISRITNAADKVRLRPVGV
jgi:hypothetical protein